MFSFFKRKKATPEADNAAGDLQRPVPADPPVEEGVTPDPASSPLAEQAADIGAAPAAVSSTAATDTQTAAQEASSAAGASHAAAPAAAAVDPVPAPVQGGSQAAPAPHAVAPAPAPAHASPAEDEQALQAPVQAPVSASGAVPAQAVPDAPSAEPAAEPSVAPVAAKTSWLARLRQGLARTGQSIGGLFVGVKVDESLFEELETALIMADAGVEATESLLAALRARVRKERLEQPEQVRAALRDILTNHLKPLEKSFPLASAAPLVVMIAGVNGAGKTTSIGKLAHAFQARGASVLLAAGDTFRAAARQQLMEWGARNHVTVIAQDGADPAAVAFDAVNAGRARSAGVVMVDTAGRLPTQLHLMEELKKIKRVIGKAQGDAPHEVLLVIDGNTGQNALAQIRAFDAALGLTGLVVTKLDGTAKGGTLAAVAAGSQGVRPVPVYWIGVGEGLQDLQPFVASEFAQALLGD